MSLQDILSNLNANYTKITDLVENINYFTDDNLGGVAIGDGGNDIYDVGNFLYFINYDNLHDVATYNLVSNEGIVDGQAMFSDNNFVISTIDSGLNTPSFSGGEDGNSGLVRLTLDIEESPVSVTFEAYEFNTTEDTFNFVGINVISGNLEDFIAAAVGHEVQMSYTDDYLQVVGYTHTGFSGGEDEENFPYHNPPMNGAVTPAGESWLIGSSAKYFTNMYPGLFVAAFNNASITFFKVKGNMGSDGNEIVTTNDTLVDEYDIYYVSEGQELVANGRKYLVYTRFSQDGSNYDPTLNHIFIVPNNADQKHQFTKSNNQNYDDILNTPNGVSELYYLLITQAYFGGEGVMGGPSGLDNSLKIAKKFLEVAFDAAPKNLPEYTFEVMTYKLQDIISEGWTGVNLEDVIRQREAATVYIADVPMKHGDRFTKNGKEALRYKKLYVDVANPLLKIV
jgi:hypothetical protein